MGTSPTEPFRFSLKLFIFNIQQTKLKMPKGAGLTKPMKLSAELADIVGKKEASRAECIKQLWAYIKKNNLQDPENKQFFNPDKKWQRFSETTAFVPLVWPSSSQLICLKLLGEYFFIYPHSWIETKPEQTWPLRLPEIYSTPLEKKNNLKFTKRKASFFDE